MPLPQAPRDRQSTHSRLAARSAASLGILLAAAAPLALAQQGDTLASVETELEYDPPHLPGHPDGPRTSKPADAPAVEPTPPSDWFGAAPYWRWETATGNWGGAREWLAARGLSFAGSYTLDWSSVWSGGINRRASTRTLLDFNLDVDLGALAGLDGGEVFIDFYSTDGRGGSFDSGDTHWISNNQTEKNLDQLAELWYQQWLFDRALRVKFGKVDANSEFAFVDCAGTFLNSAAGVSTPIFTLPTYPDPAMSANIFVYPTSWCYVGFGIYDGATADGIATGRHGPATFFSDKRSASWFSIAEAGVTWDDPDWIGAGRLAIGGWHHSADFERFDGGAERGIEGAYLLAEQQLSRAGADNEAAQRGLFAFARYAWVDENVTAAAQHIGGGLMLKGTFAGREDDEAGIFVSHLFLSNAQDAGFDGDETAFELYYRFNLTPFIHLTPDLQWVINPSGDPSIDDAVVGALRLEIDF
jgi:porin